MFKSLGPRDILPIFQIKHDRNNFLFFSFLWTSHYIATRIAAEYLTFKSWTFKGGLMGPRQIKELTRFSFFRWTVTRSDLFVFRNEGLNSSVHWFVTKLKWTKQSAMWLDHLSCDCAAAGPFISKDKGLELALVTLVCILLYFKYFLILYITYEHEQNTIKHNLF